MTDDMKFLQAVDRGDIDSVVTCIDRGVDINIELDFGVTALILAIRGRRTDIIEILLQRGALINVGSRENWNAMTWAAVMARGWDVTKEGWPNQDPYDRALEILTMAGGLCGLREAVILGDVGLAQQACDRDGSVDVSGDAYYPGN